MANAPVLLVDSNTDGLDLYSTALEIEGIRSVTARSAQEALDRMEGAAPRVLVTGLRLPGTGGTDLIRTVRQASTGSDLYIVALSTDDEVESRFAREAGCDVVLKVPCLPETLVGELRRALA
jgi:CheY-like chemotaxis protein